MGSERPNFLSQPVVKNIFMFRNGDPYYEARRLVINQKRVSNFEILLREVTGGIQAPFGAVRNIYTPRGGHQVDCLDKLQNGERYVAAGRERFKKLDYLQISSRKRRLLQSLPLQAKPLPPNRISVSARFLKPIKEPCPIFVVANGDTLNPAIRLLIHQRLLCQFERILQMITEKMGLRVLGGVRSLYTYEGQQVTDGPQLESGQLYVAVGRERFKKLSYTDLLFSKPRGARRVNGMKMGTLPPIYRSPKQNENRKSAVRSTGSGDGESKASPPNHNGGSRENLSSIVREISQARLLSLRLKRSGQSMTLCDNDDLDSKTDNGNADVKSPDQSTQEDLASDDTKSSEENGEKAEEKDEAPVENTAKNDASVTQEQKADRETNSLTRGGAEEENEAAKNENECEATAVSEEQAEDVKEVKDEHVDASKGASDENWATPDESWSEEKKVAEESEAAANVSKNVSDDNEDEISDGQKEENPDECKGEVANESKDDVADGRRVELTDKVSDESEDDGGEDFDDESKDQGTDERKAEVGDEVANERKNEDGNERTGERTDEGTNENKDEVANGSREEVTDKPSNENNEEVANESREEVADEAKDETPAENNSVTSSAGDQITGHSNNINGDTEEGQKEGNDTKGSLDIQDSGND
ncbi:doublecortin domain-containing protein 2-like [Phycodurus eques]|uniref:doublecortin domain-containing protein 2-like n=1 Tax=Phycodurus eques TaxID=693459 RepID=UPI002ACEC488|nr:doublecortin domain-containing protein 2-like [Phycodurus eques]